jgi:ABC-2 type transport system ATP-binding protein
VDDTLAQLGLGDRAGQLAGNLSGGWKQRLALAACLLHQPKLLLLDEPTAGVDPKARRDFWEKIHQLASEGITTLVSTHYMDEAERCNRLAYIAYGNLLADGTVEEVIAGAGLHTCTVSGPEVWGLQPQLRSLPGIEQVVAFGNLLHVNGRDVERLEASLSAFLAQRHGYRWHRSRATLEDVFVSLMREAEAPPK